MAGCPSVQGIPECGPGCQSAMLVEQPASKGTARSATGQGLTGGATGWEGTVHGSPWLAPGQGHANGMAGDGKATGGVNPREHRTSAAVVGLLDL